jgi:hypothetical protein
LNVLRNDEFTRFSNFARGDESWFPCHYESTQCDAKSPDDMPPETKITLVRKKGIATRIFTGMKLLVLQVLPRGKKFSQYYFLTTVARCVSRKNTDAQCKAGNDPLLGHSHNSMSRNGANSGVFRPKINNDSSSSGLFSGYLIIRLLILRICKNENERLSNHRRGPAGRPLTEVWKYVNSDRL